MDHGIFIIDRMQSLNLLALPAFDDNYIWMLHDGMQAVVVDPGDAAPVVDSLDRMGLELAAILVTHHHADHVGGVQALRPRLRGEVYAPAHERTPEPHRACQEGDRLTLLGHPIDVIDVPGHTAGHIAFVWHATHGPSWLFCGDTMFSAGCGRLFEGTPAQMHASLQKLAALPGETLVCCTHEYTLSNLRFALAVDADNPDLITHARACTSRRADGLSTLPSTIALERQINPFLRTHQPAIRHRVQAWCAQRVDVPTEAATIGPCDDVGVLAALREWKNQFK
jgi:hydroxyacylglutathione hydrolase